LNSPRQLKTEEAVAQKNESCSSDVLSEKEGGTDGKRFVWRPAPGRSFYKPVKGNLGEGKTQEIY